MEKSADNHQRDATNEQAPFGRTVESLRNRLAHDVSKLGRLIMLAEQEHVRQKGGALPNVATLRVNEKRLDSMYRRHAAAHSWLTDPTFAQKNQEEIDNFIANLRIFIHEARPYWDIPEEAISAHAEVIQFPKQGGGS